MGDPPKLNRRLVGGSRMNAPKGWCPGVLSPMEAEDGLILRIKPHLGRLSPDQCRSIADVAKTYADGTVFLTNRANLQLRGVSKDNHSAVVERLRTAGLVDDSPEAERVRNIMVPPCWQPGHLTEKLACALTQTLVASHLKLPTKFGFAIDLGPKRCLTTAPADIRIEQSPKGIIVRPDGSDHGALVTAETVVPTALALAIWFIESGGVQGDRGRMADHIARVTLPPDFSEPAVASRAAPHPGCHALGWLAGAPMGLMSAETFRALSMLGPIRLTPWRMVLIENMSGAPCLADVITDGSDPRWAEVKAMQPVLDGVAHRAAAMQQSSVQKDA